MPKKLLLAVSLWCLVCSVCVPSVHAQAAVPSPTSTPPPSMGDPPPGEPTCDLCGWCGDRKGASPPAKPPNWDACNKCLYRTDGSEKPNSFYTIIGCVTSCSDADCTTSKPGQLTSILVRSLMTLAFGVVGGIAFLMFLYGASLILTSAGDPLKLENGKDIVTSAIVGLLLIIFSVFLLRTVGFDILQIPGFG